MARVIQVEVLERKDLQGIQVIPCIAFLYVEKPLPGEREFC